MYMGGISRKSQVQKLFLYWQNN